MNTIITTALPSDHCQGMSHPVTVHVPAAVTASIVLAEGIIADVNLCDDCAACLAVTA